MITQSPQVYGERLPPALLADITAIQRNSQHLSRLVNDVLDLSQVEAGRMALSREWASVEDIVGEAIEIVHSLFESRRLYLRTEITPHLPALFCDRTRIRQVVINLLSNAGRFTEKGGVAVRAWEEKDYVWISVADTGPGIPAEDQERIFEPFQQLDASIRRRHGGSGLGLSISRSFVEMHGGTLRLESVVGIGTTIAFSLPLEAHLPDVRASDDARQWFSPYDDFEFRARTRRAKAPPLMTSPRYVILEEGETIQHLCARYLGEVEIAPVRDLDLAVAELNRSPAQVLIVNSPPSECPLAPVERLKSLPYDTPAVTCWAPGEDQAAKRLGIVRYLTKPITRAVLLSTLEDLGKGVQSLLLVDDEQEALQLFSRMLFSAEAAYDVMLAKTGQRALSLLRQRHPDVMLLDLIMPGMDGFQVLQEKARDPSIRDIPVIVISSRDPTGELIIGDTMTVTRCGGLSVRDFLALVQAISGILSPTS
jgi:CheY-like chemotaxis protein/anti-sigma regulatory factor (Ser/Thr protein kinase)